MQHDPNEKSHRLLVVDDEQIMCDLLQFNLENDGYKVDINLSAEDALKRDLSVYDLLILDIMMGEMSGIKLAERMKARPETAHIPIIFCSAKGDVDDVVNGLNAGADDYVPKPFSMKEMKARVRTVLRRNAPHKEEKLAHKTLVIDTEARRVTIDSEIIALTRTEYDMLVLFMRNPNHFFSRNEIFDHVWPEQVVVVDRTIDVNISRMRKKLGIYAACIVNRSGIGYGFLTQ